MGWTTFDGICFYISNDLASSWNSAEDDCRKRGGHLAVPTNSKINDYLYQTIKRHKLIATWIGVYRRTGRQFYTVGNVEISYKNWNRWEPNNVGGRENCVEMLNTHAAGTWNDRPCNLNDRRYVCQRCLWIYDSSCNWKGNFSWKKETQWDWTLKY